MQIRNTVNVVQIAVVVAIQSFGDKLVNVMNLYEPFKIYELNTATQIQLRIYLCFKLLAKQDFLRIDYETRLFKQHKP